MHVSGIQLRSIYTFLFVIVLCGILWTGYFIGTDHDVFAPLRPLPSFGSDKEDHYSSPPSQEIGQPAGFPFGHAVDVTVPSGVKIIGLVFFGRRELVKILDCYLKVLGSLLLIPCCHAVPLTTLNRGTFGTTGVFWMKSFSQSTPTRGPIWHTSRNWWHHIRDTRSM